jgi:uncharacterized protein (TIGR03437 family)
MKNQVTPLNLNNRRRASQDVNMRLLLVLAICGVLPSFAQFSSMATDYAGQRLLFTTNLSQTGSGQPDYGKLFVADWRGVQALLIYNYDDLSTSGLDPGQPGLLTNFYNVDGVDVSSSGAYISVTARRACEGLGYTALLCGYADQSTLYDRRGQVALTAAGRVIVSASGKWALAVQKSFSGPGTYFLLYDMTNGASFKVASVLTANTDWFHDVADDGTVVIASEAELLICGAAANCRSVMVDWKGLLGTGIRSAVIDAAGTAVVWAQTDEPGNSILHALQTVDLGKTMNLGVSGWADSQPRISDDGSRILFLSTPIGANDPQVFLMAIDGTARRRVTVEPEGIAKAVLSGNGQVVWALTRTGRLLKIDIDTGGRTQYTEPLAAFLDPYFSSDPATPFVSGLLTPGEVISVSASVMPGERVELTVQGQPAPVVRVEPQTVVFEIPWTAQVGMDTGKDVELAIRKPDSSSWSGDKLNVYLGVFGPRLLASVHQDFSALISAKQPAQAGEIIHFFGTGFGPVTPPVPDGAPAPVAPLSRTVNAVTCDVLNYVGADTGPAHVLFAGLAPGMIGIYQLDVQLPDLLPGGSSVQVFCHVGNSGAAIQVPVRQ